MTVSEWFSYDNKLLEQAGDNISEMDFNVVNTYDLLYLKKRLR